MSNSQHNTISRRAFLKAGALTVGGTVLAACAAPGAAPAGESGGEAAASMETIELRLSAWADVQDAVVYENYSQRLSRHDRGRKHFGGAVPWRLL